MAPWHFFLASFIFFSVFYSQLIFGSFPIISGLSVSGIPPSPICFMKEFSKGQCFCLARIFLNHSQGPHHRELWLCPGAFTSSQPTNVSSHRDATNPVSFLSTLFSGSLGQSMNPVFIVSNKVCWFELQGICSHCDELYSMGFRHLDLYCIGQPFFRHKRVEIFF